MDTACKSRLQSTSFLRVGSLRAVCCFVYSRRCCRLGLGLCCYMSCTWTYSAVRFGSVYTTRGFDCAEKTPALCVSFVDHAHRALTAFPPRDNNMVRIVSTLALLAAAALGASAAVVTPTLRVATKVGHFWVSGAGGSDENSGQHSSPFKTVQHCVQAVVSLHRCTVLVCPACATGAALYSAALSRERASSRVASHSPQRTRSAIAPSSLVLAQHSLLPPCRSFLL
jgi:hypothetical protein